MTRGVIRTSSHLADSVNRADRDEKAKLYAVDAIWESPLLDMRFEPGAEFYAHLA